MILIPAGDFLMGSDPSRDESAHRREMPQHLLNLPDYYLARTPVTNAQYSVFVHETGCRAPDHWLKGTFPVDKKDHPVVHVTWYEALGFCRWLAGVTGKPYRLPSEAEWEKGASWDDALPTDNKRLYPWGDEFNTSRCNTKEADVGDTTPVGAYPQGASPYGLLDMAGNVFEWTRSLWGTDIRETSFGYPYVPTDGREDIRSDKGVLRVLRGGAFYYNAGYARAAHRVKSYPDYRVKTRGFRVCLVSE